MRPSFVAAAIVSSVLASQAIAADPAREPVQALCDGLVAIMKAGRQAGLAGREKTIGPIVDGAFDLPLMTRLAIGPGWTALSASDQAALADAFRRMTIQQYAANFDEWSGQSFTVAPNVEARGGDRLVRTTLSEKGGATTAIAYRLRQSGEDWKIIDVFYQNSISQLATRRADFARVLATGGVKALIGHLNDLASKAPG